MRIAFVNSMRSLGGGERWLLEMARGLSERGHEIGVVTRAGARLAEAAGQDGHRVLSLPMTGDFDPVSIVRLASWLRIVRPNVLSVNVQRAVRIGCSAARLAGRRGVVERRGLNFAVRPTRLNRWVYGRCLSLVIANCSEIREQLVASGLVPVERTTVVYNGIDPARVPSGGGEAVRSELGIGPDQPVISIVARLVRDKGHVYAFEAFGRFAGRRPGARLLVVGEGKLREELRGAARESAPPGSITFLGSRDDVPAILNATDVLLVSSLREGMPHSILEAMVAGVPIVATEVAGIPEMIASGRDGILVPSGSASAMEAAIERMIGDAALSRRMAESAGRRVRAEFGLERMIDETERCFERVAASGADGRGAPS